MILPGMIETELLTEQASLTDSVMKNNLAKYPLGFGRVTDVSHLAQFLLDPEKSRWISGSEIIIDGGYLLQ
jgi:NAD(P)-dependent dehydrogenase (short-subunit alcohol dehydrogenase family)